MSLKHLRNESATPKRPPNGRLPEGAIAIDLVSGDVWAGTGTAVNNPPVLVGGAYSISATSNNEVSISGDGTANNPISADLVISPDADNLLSVRGDGIGVWKTSDPEYSNFYVSNNWGSDSNSGTSKDDPLATFGEACRRVAAQPGSGRFTIFLRAGETFITDKDSWLLASKSLSVVPYDDPKYGDGSWGPCTNYCPSNASDFWRPTLRIAVLPQFDTPEVPRYAVCAYIRCLQLTMRGIVLEGMDNNTGLPYYGMSPLLVSPQVEMISCYIRPRHFHQYITYRANLVTLRCQLERTGTDPNHPYHAELVSWRDFSSYPSSAPACGGRSGYNSIMPSNIRTLIRPYNISAGALYDTATKTMFGCDVNWDIFK